MPDPTLRQPPRPSSRSLRIAGAVVVVLLVATGALERALTEQSLLENRADVRSLLGAYGSALERSMAEHTVLVEAVAAWSRQRPDATRADFDAYASTLYQAGPEVLAVNLVRGSEITEVFPFERNRAALGIDLATHTVTESFAGLRRAISTGGVSMAGPLPLAQGVSGLILFRTGGVDPDGDLVVAEIVVEVDALLADAGVDVLDDEYLATITSRGGERIRGVSGPFPGDASPVEVAVRVPDGPWTLSAVPIAGWGAEGRLERWVTRLGLLTVVGLVGVIVFGVANRDTRLVQAVDERTRALLDANRELEAQRSVSEAAMAAGGVVVWSWDLQTDRLQRAGTLLADHGLPAVESSTEYLERVHPDDRPILQERFDEARRTGSLEAEFRERLEDGRWAWLRTIGKVVEGEEGDAVQMLGAAADITRIKELESELLHHGRVELIGQIAGGVVHDINNALSVVLGELEFAVAPGSAAEEAEEAARQAAAAGRYASVLTGQLLTFARKDRVAPELFEWDGLCEESTSFLSRVLGRGVRVETTWNARGACVRMDRTQAMQVLANLATNARDAMGSGGTLRISSRIVENGREVAPKAAAAPAIVTEVRDEGPGIRPDLREAVFEPFFTTKEKGQGTGLGLSTSRRILRDSGGDLVFSTSERGTTFSIVLPCLPD